MKKFDEQIFIATCKNSLTMAQAAREMNMHFNTFKRHAVRLGCYHTNPSGKGVQKSRPQVIATQDILAGKYPDYGTYKLKNVYCVKAIWKIDVSFAAGRKKETRRTSLHLANCTILTGIPEITV